MTGRQKSVALAALLILLSAGIAAAQAAMPWLVPATSVTTGIIAITGFIAILAGVGLGVAIISGAGRAISVAAGALFGLSIIGWAIAGGFGALFGIA